MEDKILCRGGRLLGSTDGSAKLYKCATAVFLMSMLDHTFGIVVDRALGAPGHDKSEVDAINGVDKNTIQRKSMRKLVHTAVAFDPSQNSTLQAHSFTNIFGQK